MNRVWTSLEQASDAVGDEDGNCLVRRVDPLGLGLGRVARAIGKFSASTIYSKALAVVRMVPSQDIRAGQPVQPS